MTKENKNLSLDPAAIRRGGQYSAVHETNVSRLVNEFLSGLPLEGRGESSLSPAVRRLRGIARDASGVEDFRLYLLEKYAR